MDGRVLALLEPEGPNSLVLPAEVGPLGSKA